ncbi:hypothetical protein PLICRDRAFT_28915 [Plicaturopsis crispa FD-325 SS-3]|nr:hypothetical protein PLICRDRAFT_28915 [Plicaturopsis crispa FD-325 SS-3]
MKTRRKSRAAAAAASSQAASSQGADETSSAQTFNVAIPADLDRDVLSSLLPDVSLTSPSPEAVASIYRVLLAQVAEADAAQRDLDQTRAEVDKKDVELDQALQDRESLAKELETSLESVQGELNQVKQERDQLAASRAELQVQITSLSSSQSTSSTEADSLKHRMEDTEREKRDLVVVVSRLKEDSTQREEEIHTLRANLKQARQDHQELESQVRELRSVETSTKFKVDSLSQQLQLSQSETERTSAELTAKSDEFAKYRRSKHAEMTQLQASYDALTQTHASTESSLKALQSAHTAQTHQLTQALARVQDLTGQLAEQEATYASEASGLRRLVGMMEEREAQAKEVVERIESDWASVGERSAKREGALRDEIDRERSAREEAEKRVEQLETVMQKMDRGELPMPIRPGTPQTPGYTSDLLSQGMMGLSPTVAMASRVQRSGKTFTEVYSDYVRLQEEYARKCAEYDHMDRTLSAVLAQIEERAPILSQQRAEYERLQSEAGQLASQLAEALAERDSQANLAQDNSQKLSKSIRENDLLQKQLEDLGRQVQVLLRELGRQSDPSIPSEEDLERMEVPPAESIDAVITNNLVLFRSIGGLQEQNQKLLKIVRELGEKMESEEKEYRDALEKEQGEAVREAHEAMQELAAQLERQKKSSDATIQAYMKERDALKSMLARAERGAPTSNGTSSRGLAINGERHDTEENPSGDLAKEFVEVQNQFEAYRTEMSVDSVRLREEAIAAQREVGQLGAALAKANAKIEYLTDRHRMAQEQSALQGRELDNLTKRNQQMYDQYTRIDIECNRASEDLIVANGHIEQLRNECANLRAEKKIWESVQGRLVEENKTLAVERSHLSDLMANVQRMHNDMERSSENDRRRLETQMNMLESQTQDLRAQISQERDTVRHLSLQKEIELKELQARLDKTTQELSKTRESLVGAETSKKHLEERVEELTRQLQGNEEKLAVYERRTTGVNGVAQQVDTNLSREQQLESEVAELRSALKVAEMDLATARSHVQQFQEISQANEAALATLSGTYDEFKASTEAQIAQHESDYKALEETLQSVQVERTQMAEKLGELQHTYDAERTAWMNDKKTLEDTIVDMSTSEKHTETDRELRESEARSQEERARAAEERYAREVITHAESIKAVKEYKEKLVAAENAARSSLTAAETANAKLASSEASWKQQKEALDKEMSDLNKRCVDLATQNSTLLQHLESVTSQANRIRQAADSSASVGTSEEGTASEDADTKLSELRSVVSYLRKEKEIVDLQLELSKQENVRLKSQIDHLSQTLDETRATLSELSQERERAVETAASETQHAELIERINQLNILRESNATLRSDCESHAKRSRELDAKLKQLSAELDPVKEQARVAQAELASRDAQLKRLEEENRRWQERNTQLLSKYDRIDPAEVQALKNEIEQLKAEKTEAQAANEQTIVSQKQRIDGLEKNMKAHREQLAKTNANFRQLKSEHMKSDSANKDVQQQLETLQREKASLEKALAEEKLAKPQGSVENAAEQELIIAALRDERDRLLAEKASWTAASSTATETAPATDEDKVQWEIQKAELIKARDEAVAQVKAAVEEVRKSNEETKNIRFANEKCQTRLEHLQKARNADNERFAAQQQAAVSAAIEKARNEAGSSTDGDAAAKRLAEELQALEQRLTLKHQAELQTAVEAAKAASQSTAPGAPADDAAQKAAIEAAVAAAVAEVRSRHTEELAAAVESGRREQAAKGKLKDSQLVRAQNKVKALEAQILEWRQKGVVPPESTDAPPAPPATPIASSSTAPSVPTAPPATPTAGLPRKPSIDVPPSTTPTRGAVRGATRGITRGVTRGLNIRGAAPGRGGSPARGGAPTNASAGPPATQPGGVSIMGAAAKRARDEGEGSADDSLAKRLKPAPAENAGGSGKPVTLRRPPPTS